MQQATQLGALEQQVAALRIAAQTLASSADGQQKRRATQILSTFLAQPAFRLNIELLKALPHDEALPPILAASLVSSSSVIQDALENESLFSYFVPSLVQLLTSTTAAQKWTIAAPLASTLAMLALRAPSWDAGTILSTLGQLFQWPSSLGHHSAQQQQQLAVSTQDAYRALAVVQVVASFPEAHSVRTAAVHPLRRSAVAQALIDSACISDLLYAAVVQLGELPTSSGLSSAAGLPSLLAAANLGLTPDEWAQEQWRQLVLQQQQQLSQSASLQQQLHLQPLTPVDQSISMEAKALSFSLGMSICHGWAEQLGRAPCGLHRQPLVIKRICQAAFQPQTAQAAANTLCALLSTCTPAPRPASEPAKERGSGSACFRQFRGSQQPKFATQDRHEPPPSVQATADAQLLLLVILQQWHACCCAVSTAHAAATNGAKRRDAAIGENSSPAAVTNIVLPFLSPSSTTGAGANPQLMAGNKAIAVGVCAVLCATGVASLPGTLAGDAELGAYFAFCGPLLLQCLRHSEDDVALNALDFWQDTFIVSLQRLDGTQLKGSPQQAVVQAANEQLLEQVAVTMVLRTALRPEVAMASTADARDLPEDVRNVRRGLASGLRDVSHLIGHERMLQYMASLVMQMLRQYNERCSPGPPGPCDWVRLECALYASNVAVGRCPPSQDPPALMHLVDAAVACIHHAFGSPKMSGTVLTILGGIPQWLSRHPATVTTVLNALQTVLVSTNDSLVRNAATTVLRLCQHGPLAVLIVTNHPAWVANLVTLQRSMLEQRRRSAQISDTKYQHNNMAMTAVNISLTAANRSGTTVGQLVVSTPCVDGTTIGGPLNASGLVVGPGGGNGGPARNDGKAGSSERGDDVPSAELLMAALARLSCASPLSPSLEGRLSTGGSSGARARQLGLQRWQPQPAQQLLQLQHLTSPLSDAAASKLQQLPVALARLSRMTSSLEGHDSADEAVQKRHAQAAMAAAVVLQEAQQLAAGARDNLRDLAYLLQNVPTLKPETATKEAKATVAAAPGPGTSPATSQSNVSQSNLVHIDLDRLSLGGPAGSSAGGAPGSWDAPVIGAGNSTPQWREDEQARTAIAGSSATSAAARGGSRNSSVNSGMDVRPSSPFWDSNLDSALAEGRASAGSYNSSQQEFAPGSQRAAPTAGAPRTDSLAVVMTDVPAVAAISSVDLVSQHVTQALASMWPAIQLALQPDLMTHPVGPAVLLAPACQLLRLGLMATGARNHSTNGLLPGVLSLLGPLPHQLLAAPPVLLLLAECVTYGGGAGAATVGTDSASAGVSSGAVGGGTLSQLTLPALGLTAATPSASACTSASTSTRNFGIDRSSAGSNVSSNISNLSAVSTFAGVSGGGGFGGAGSRPGSRPGSKAGSCSGTPACQCNSCTSSKQRSDAEFKATMEALSATAATAVVTACAMLSQLTQQQQASEAAQAHRGIFGGHHGLSHGLGGSSNSLASLASLPHLQNPSTAAGGATASNSGAFNALLDLAVGRSPMTPRQNEITSALLQLAGACLTSMPEPLTHAHVMQALLAATLRATACRDTDVCKVTLKWIQKLGSCASNAPPMFSMNPPSQSGQTNAPGGTAYNSTAYGATFAGPPRTSTSAPSSFNAPRHASIQGLEGSSEGGSAFSLPAPQNPPSKNLGGASVSDLVDPGRMARDRLALASLLDQGVGPQLILALLVCAAGSMPPEYVLEVSAAVHGMWRAVGQTRFVTWLLAAVESHLPPDAPWARVKRDALLPWVAELTAPCCITDVPRFKRVLKTFCGGKKSKGGKM